MGAFKIRIPDFEGPLDLLLFFIKRDELDIYDIPIAHITKEFLSYVHMMQLLDLEVAGDFIVMAATLMQIKARMLLPRTETEDGEEEIDPRAELTQRLLEYKRFKEAALGLQDRELDQRQRFVRTYFRQDVRSAPVEADEQVLRDVTLFDLIKAFQKAMTSMPKPVVHEVRQIPYSIEDQGLFLLRLLEHRRTMNFLDVATHMREKIQLVVTFIALLELIRAQRVRVEMHADFNNFTIIRREHGAGPTAEDLPLGIPATHTTEDRPVGVPATHTTEDRPAGVPATPGTEDLPAFVDAAPDVSTEDSEHTVRHDPS